MTHNKRKILLVDDDRFMLTLVCRYLSKKDFHCFSAESVQDALKILEFVTPDIILSDYNMPEMDGFQFRKKVLSKKQWKNIPFVFFTSFVEHELMQKGLNMHAIDYIDKSTPIPVVASKLINILETIQKQHEQSIYELGAAARALNLRSVPSTVPDIDGFKVDFLYQTFESYPGGDFIDFIATDNGYTFVIFGDVMGKKWGAWFFSFNFLSYIRSAIRLCIFEGDTSTASIIHKINRVVNMDPVLNDVLSTLSLLMIDNATGEIKYSGAGDLPMIWFKSEYRRLTEVSSSGLLLGIMEEGEYDEQIIRMMPGDQLILVTDGMTDVVENDHTRTDYPSFLKKVTPMLGREDTFDLLKRNAVSGNKKAKVVDDQSLLFIERIAKN